MKDTILTWDPMGFDWIKGALEDGEVIQDEEPCPTCGKMRKVEDKEEAAYRAWCNWGAQDEWDYFTDELSYLLARLAPDGYIRIDGENMGWLHRSGWKEVDLIPHKGDNTGSYFLHEVMPNTEYHLWARAEDSERTPFNPWAEEEREVKFVVIEIAHHDAPMGGEMYYVTHREEEDEDEE